MYERVNFQNHIVTNPRTYNVVDNADGTKTLNPAPGTVIQEGTPINANNLNQMDAGIAAVHMAVGEVETLDEMFGENNMIGAVNMLARPEFTVAAEESELTSGETFKKSLGKIAKAIKSFILHLSAKNPHQITPEDIGAVSTDYNEWVQLNVEDVFEINEGFTFKSTSRVYRKGNHMYANMIAAEGSVTPDSSRAIIPLKIKSGYRPHVNKCTGTRINTSPTGQMNGITLVLLATSGNVNFYFDEFKDYGNDRYPWTGTGGSAFDWEM